MSIAERYALVRDEVAAAARRAGRDPGGVTVVAVVKTWPPAVVEEAFDAGIEDVGESRAQDLRAKTAALGDRGRWHFVGALQSNKVRHVVGTATLVHSVDRLALAAEVDKRARAAGMVQDVLMQVSLGGEQQKAGMAPEGAQELAERIAALSAVRLRGLMTIPPLTQDPAGARPYFRRLAALSAEVASRWPEASELSMGMTRDYAIAVEEGATLVRVGTAIFGPRPG